MKHNYWFVFLLSVLVNNAFSSWGVHGKKVFNQDTSPLNDTIDNALNNMMEDTARKRIEEAEEMSPYLRSLQVIKTDIFIDDKLIFTGDINTDQINFYKLGKKVSRKDSHEYQNKYMPLSLMSGFIFPIGGPFILNNFYKKKEKPLLKNEYNFSNTNFNQLKLGYMDVYNRKRIIKSAGLGTVGSILGIGLYFYIVVIVSEIINPSQPIK